MNWLLKTKPPFIYKLFILLMVLISFLPINRLIRFPFNLFGIILLIIGVYISVSTKNMFIRTRTPMNPLAKPEKLHIDGIFSHTRNPMYLGIVIGLFGVSIITGLLLNIIFPIVYFVIMDIEFIPKEENNLKETFGSEFVSFKKRTRRWL